MTPAEPTIPVGEAERIGLAIETAWNGSGSKGRPNDLPPIELTEHERYHIGAAAFGAMAPRTPEPTGDTREQVARAIADGFSGGNEQYDQATADQRERYDEAARCVLAALPPARDAEVERLADILDTERYKVAIALEGIKRAIDGRRWLSEPGRGSYTYDDERYQAEFGQALNEIDAALKPLRTMAGDWSDCPRDPLRVAANRRAALSASDGKEGVS